ncbi:MAG: hypothetical protein AAF434_07370 [Pseudomonadota bacterium]
MSSITLPTKEFDIGPRTASKDVLRRMQEILIEARDVGIDVEAMCIASKIVNADQAQDTLNRLFEATSLLFIQWQRVTQVGDRCSTLAYARIINGITLHARDLNANHGLVDTAHLDLMAEQLESDVCFKDFDPECVAAIMDRAAKAHVHEVAWMWTVLPTFAKQPYGRILLRKVDVPSLVRPIFVTQPYFLEGRTTLYHTHGQNWAFSRPLGKCETGNTHLNTLWMPRSKDNAFPLDQIDNSEYCNKTVVVVPPKMIHGIERGECCRKEYPTLAELQDDASLKARWIEQTRFGENACMHIYCPHPPLVKELEQSPFVKENERFFFEYDMIVFDQLENTIWSGGGGSWPLRMIEYGTTGTHCGMCFEDDPRKENLDPAEVAKWFIQSPPPPLMRYQFPT